MVESHSLQNNRWAYILNSALGFQEWLITVKYEDEQGGKNLWALVLPIQLGTNSQAKNP